MTADEYLAMSASIITAGTARTWTTELVDGRTILLFHQPMPDGGWVETHEDITELKATRAVVNERLSLQALIDSLPDSLWVKDVNSRFVIANKAIAAIVGQEGPADLIGKTDLELLPLELAQKFLADERQIIQSGQSMFSQEEYAWGNKRWLSTTKVPLRNDQNEISGLIGISRDITERRLADLLRDGQARILEMIAMSAPLGDVLENLVLLVEGQFNGIVGSVLLLDETGTRLRCGAAPSLSDSYAKAIEGVRIGPNAGSSGTAVYRREAVVVADVMTDPLW
jgi:PAS domain S-box-containing protein